MRRRTEKPVPPLPSPLQKRPGAWKRTPVTPPLKTNVPGKPSGNLERYLVRLVVFLGLSGTTRGSWRESERRRPIRSLANFSTSS
jgi:hypothetical protein